MNHLKKLLQKWHWLHTWTEWQDGPVYQYRYSWTKPGWFAFLKMTQTKSCLVCNQRQHREVRCG